MPEEPKNHDVVESDQDKVIGSSTPVRIGLVIAVLASYTAAVWWAAGISSTLSAVDARLKTIESSNSNRAITMDQLDTRLKMIEQFGSPAMQARLREVERTLDATKRGQP